MGGRRKKTSLSSMTKLSEWILENCYTRTEALAKLRTFNDLGQKRIFSNSQESEDDRNGGFDHDLWKDLNERNFNRTVEKSEEEIKSFPVLTVCLARELPEAEMRMLEEFIQKSFSEKFLIDFRIDSELISGCAIVWRGKYRDFSVRERLQRESEEIKKLIKI